MDMHIRILAASAGVALLGAASDAASPSEAYPQIVKELMECRSITDPAARLACFDKRSAAVDVAAQNKDLLILDKQQVKETNRSLFGLNLPNLAIFGGRGHDDSEKTEVSEIETVIASASYSNYRWIIRLPDGAKWVQVGTDQFLSDPKAGQKIRIRKAALGSFFVNVNGQRGVKMRREN